MNRFLKEWLRDRGITAAQIARTAGIPKNTTFYNMLRGATTVSASIHDTLVNIDGMTEQEYQKSIPKRGEQTCTREL